MQIILPPQNQSPNTGAKTIITAINAIRSKGPSPTLCAQTNAQPDYVTLSRRSRLHLCLRPRLRLFRLRQSSDRTYIDKRHMTTNRLELSRKRFAYVR